MQIEVNKKRVITVLTFIAVGILLFIGYNAINKNINQNSNEIRKNITDKANKKDIAEMTASLETKINHLETKIDEMNKQMTTAQATTPASTTTTNENSETTETTTTTTDSSDTEEALLEELGEDIDDMKEIQEEAVSMLSDVNNNIEDLTETAEDVADSTGSIASDLNTLIDMATQTQIKAQEKSQQAQEIITQYSEQIAANQNILTAREELFNATKNGNKQTISAAENKLISALNTNGSQISPVFAQQYFKQIPSSFGNISGINNAMNNIKVNNFNLDISKVQFAKPSFNTEKTITKDFIR